MPYEIQIGLKYLRSKKSSTVSVITFIAVGGVALGVAALLSVLSITSGFREAFRTKVLGVNSHVLVLKYGLDFDEYRDVIARAREMPEVAGAAPFVINEMMLANGDRIGGVLVKGVDPEAMSTVLDLPDQMIQGSLRGLRREGAQPPANPDQLGLITGGDEDLDEYLAGFTEDAGTEEETDAGAGAEGEDPLSESEMEELRDRLAGSDGTEPVLEPDEEPEGAEGEGPEEAAEWVPLWDREPDAEAGDEADMDPDSEGELAQGGNEVEALPEVSVPTLEEAELALQELDEGQDLPDDAIEQQIFEEEELFLQESAGGAADLPGIVVGTTLARNLGIGVGDHVRVISPLAGLDTSWWAPQARTPRSREFEVIGIFEAGFQEYDSRLVYVDLYEAQAFFDQGDTVTGVEIRLHDLEQAPEVARRIERELGGGPFHTMDWEELNHNLFTALKIQQAALSIVIATIIVVAAFNVVATLIMIVLDKKREIAILKAMGAKDLSVLVIFMIQGVVIGLFGTFVGLLLGGGVVGYLSIYHFPLDPKVYLIDHLPVVVSPWEFIMTIAVAFAICVVATLIPSWWAARMLPADGVRHE